MSKGGEEEDEEQEEQEEREEQEGDPHGRRCFGRLSGHKSSLVALWAHHPFPFKSFKTFG